jgi:hypothetical protein
LPKDALNLTRLRSNEADESVRRSPTGFIASIREDELPSGDLDYQDFKRLPREDEAVVLRSLLETFISRAWCLRQPCDGSAVLTYLKIKATRRADYWQQQAYAVMLVIRASDGEIRWMDVSAYLKRESAGGKTVTQIVFEGERFDVMSVQNWRKKVLRQ